jgi:hypothetical protein
MVVNEMFLNPALPAFISSIKQFIVSIDPNESLKKQQKEVVCMILIVQKF